MSDQRPTQGLGKCGSAIEGRPTISVRLTRTARDSPCHRVRSRSILHLVSRQQADDEGMIASPDDSEATLTIESKYGWKVKYEKVDLSTFPRHPTFSSRLSLGNSTRSYFRSVRGILASCWVARDHKEDEDENSSPSKAASASEVAGTGTEVLYRARASGVTIELLRPGKG